MKGRICIENNLSEDDAYDEGGCKRSARNTDLTLKWERMFRERLMTDGLIKR